MNIEVFNFLNDSDENSNKEDGWRKKENWKRFYFGAMLLFVDILLAVPMSGDSSSRVCMAEKFFIWFTSCP